MSDEKQQDLPSIPAGGLAGIDQRNLAAAFANLPPLDWDEASTDSSKPKPAEQEKMTLPTQASRPRATSSRQRTSSPVKEDTPPSPPTKGSRKRSAIAREEKAPDARPADVAANKETPAVAARRARSRKKDTKSMALPEQTGPKSSRGLPAESDMPQITDEAIAFLGTPDAKASDLFKLQPASQAFVQYHITNMQRLEAASELANARLMAAAPKFSRKFEKVADAMLQTLAKRQQPPTRQQAAALVEKSPAEPAVSYRPASGSITAQAQIPVQLRTFEIGTSAPSGVPERMEQLGNVIERGNAPERVQEPHRDSQVHGSPGSATAPDRPVSASFLNMKARIIHVVSSKVRATETWLKQRGNEGPSAPAPIEPRPQEQLAFGTASPGSTTAELTKMPDAVSRRFLNVNQDYYFPDKTHAFRDDGNKLATRVDHPEVVRSLIEIAKARGWDSITVKGSDQFRRHAWLEASKSGLVVAGYKPSALDLAELAQQPIRNMVEKDVPQSQAKEPTGGPARQPDSSRSQLTATPDPTAKPISNDGASKADLAAKAQAFESDKPAFAVKKHPDLAPAYGVVDVAKKFAEAHLPKNAREEFIGLARRHVIQQIIAGEHVRGPRIHVVRGREHEAQEHSGVKAAVPVDLGTRVRAKEVAKEK